MSSAKTAPSSTSLKKDGLPHEYVGELLLDKYGRIWAGTHNGLALMRDRNKEGKCGVQQVYREIGGVKRLDIQALAEGPDGAIWAGCDVGIARSISGAPVFRMLTRTQGLIDHQVHALATDGAGNVWAGTEGAGVMKIQPAGFTTFREQDGLATDRVKSVFRDRAGTVLAVTTSASAPDHDSVNIWDGAEFPCRVSQGFQRAATMGNPLCPAAGPDRRVVGSDSGGALPVRTCPGSGPGGETASGLLCAGHGRVPDLRGCQGPHLGLGAIRGHRAAHALGPCDEGHSWFEDGPNRHELVSAFAEDRDGNVWMGLRSGGDLLRYNGRQFTRFMQTDGVPTATIDELLVDSGGRLWIAAWGGLGLVYNPGSPHIGVRVYKTSNGLACDTIHCLIEDTAGRIYAGTAKGVDRLDARSGHIKHFSTVDGLAHGEIRRRLGIARQSLVRDHARPVEADPCRGPAARHPVGTDHGFARWTRTLSGFASWRNANLTRGFAALFRTSFRSSLWASTTSRKRTWATSTSWRAGTPAGRDRAGIMRRTTPGTTFAHFQRVPAQCRPSLRLHGGRGRAGGRRALDSAPCAGQRPRAE